MRITVQTKMLAGFVAVLVLAGIVGGVGLTQTNTLSQQLELMYDENLLPVAYTSDIEGTLQSRAKNLRNVIVFTYAKDSERVEQAKSAMDEEDQHITGMIAKLEAIPMSSDEKNLLDSFKAAYSEYKAVTDNIVKATSTGQADGAVAQLRSAENAVSKVIGLVQELEQFAMDEAAKVDEESHQTAAQASTTILIILAVAIVLGLGIALFIGRDIARMVGLILTVVDRVAVGDLNRDMDERTKNSIRNRSDEMGAIGRGLTEIIRYMQGMADHAKAIAEGDLTQHIEPNSAKDELGIAFQQMSDNLKEMVSGVVASSTRLNDASHQLSSASAQAGAATQQITTTIQQVASGTQEQSGAIQETNASVEQLARAIDQIAKGAQEQASAIQKMSSSVSQLNASIDQTATATEEVSVVAQKVQDVAASGADTVKRTVHGMAAIKDSTSTVAVKVSELGSYSEQIGSIVETIDDIAEQTNLLALNAAIEAARAGEHGRGFAVVADEVRKLAERSSKSTKEIAGLIAQVQKGTQEAVSAMDRGAKEVEQGAELAEESGVALGNILEEIQVAVERIGRIVAATQQMEAIAKEVTEQMGSVSAVVEESTAATEEMAASSQQVMEMTEKVAAVSEETSASAEEVSASTEEMSAQVEEMVAQAEDLSRMASELQNLVSRFNIDKETEVVMMRRKDDWQRSSQMQGQLARLSAVDSAMEG